MQKEEQNNRNNIYLWLTYCSLINQICRLNRSSFPSMSEKKNLAEIIVRNVLEVLITLSECELNDSVCNFIELISIIPMNLVFIVKLVTVFRCLQNELG